MRRHRRPGAGRRPVAVLVGMLCTFGLLSVGLLPDGGAAALEPGEATGLAGNGVVEIDEQDVAVVAASAPVDGRVAVVLENRSGQPRRVRKVVGFAAAVDGARVVRASTRDIVPSVLAPGARALGSLRFPADEVRLDDTFSFEVRTGGVRARDPLPLAVGGFELSAPMTGAVAQTLAVDVTNAGSDAVVGPIDVQVVCLGESGRPAVGASHTVASAELGSGETERVTVELAELCNAYVVAAQGATPRR